MARRSLFVAAAATLLLTVLPVGAGAQTTVPPNAYLAAGTYAGADLKAFTARDAQPIYTDALKQACSNAADVDAALATGPPSGNGVLLGTTDGRIVVSESIRAFPNAKAAQAVRVDGEGVVGLRRVRRTRLVQPGLRAIPAGRRRSPPSRRPSGAAARPRRRPSRARPTRHRSSGVDGADRLGPLRSRDVDPDRGAEARRARRAVAERVGRRLVRRALGHRRRHRSEALRSRRTRSRKRSLRAPASVALRLRAAWPRTGVPVNPPSCQAMTDAVRVLGRERRGSQLRRSGRHDARHRPARDHRVPEAGGRRPLSGGTTAISRSCLDDPLQERASRRVDGRGPAVTEARRPVRREGFRVRRPWRTSPRSRGPTARRSARPPSR